MAYIERGTSFKHKGKSYSAGGASVNTRTAIAYMGKEGAITNWKGKKISTYRVVSSWRTPNSYMSDRMYQLEATIGGKVYTGRSAGVGMIFKGKRKAAR